MKGHIAKLPRGVVSQLRSTTVLSDIGQVVEELLCNSLDAGATRVRTHLEDGAASIKVEDNGHGITRDDLTMIGERHATSKVHDLRELEEGIKTLGFRGEALSSLSDISILEITSRVQGSPHTYCKIMKGHQTVSLGLCSQQRAHGTTVVVRDIFYNQPVRRRLFFSSHKKALQSVKEHVLRLALAHSHVSFTVTDFMRQEEVIYIRQQTSLYHTLQDVFGPELCYGLHEIDLAKGHLRFSGFISKSFSHTSSKDVQYFYINHRFVEKTPVHKILNAWGKRRYLEKEGSSAALGQQGYPTFVLNLSCQMSEYDITFEASKSYVEFKDWTPVLSFVEDVLERSWGNCLIKKPEPEAAIKSTRKRKLRHENDSTTKASGPLEVSHSRAVRLRMGDFRPDLAGSPCVPRISFQREQRSTGASPVKQHFAGVLGSNDPFSPVLAPSFEPALLGVKDSNLDLDVQLPPFVASCSSPLALMLKPQCRTLNLLGLDQDGQYSVANQGMQQQPLSGQSSPVVSDGSWGCGFEPYPAFEDVEVHDSSPTHSSQISKCELKKPAWGVGTNESSRDLLWSMSASETWDRNDCDLRSRMMESLWMVHRAPTPTREEQSFDDLLHPDQRAWDERGQEVDDVPETSCSNADKTDFSSNLLRWSGRDHEDQSQVCAIKQIHFSDPNSEDFWERTSQPLLSGRSSPERNLDDHEDPVLHWGSPGCSEPCLQSQRHPKECFLRPPLYSGRQNLGLNNNYVSTFQLPVASPIQDEGDVQPNSATCSTAKAVNEQRVVVEISSKEESTEQACPRSAPQDLQLSKWRSTDQPPGDKGLSKDTVAAMYKVWLNPCMRASASDVLDLSVGILGSSSSSLLPESVTKESLQHARVLRQVDTKFIAVVAQNVLLLVDQHAADERVRLEEFRAQVLAADKKQTSPILDGTHELTLGFAEQQTLHTYEEQVEHWGWHFQTSADFEELGNHLVRARNGAACKVQLRAVPCILGVNLTAADLEEYLQQLAVTHGASAPPPAVIRLLKYKSCRGAIMFGDALLPAECRQLVKQLKLTSLCFQCAHGRPTMVPLVNLSVLRRRFELQPKQVQGCRVDGGRAKETAVWHGLRSCQPSLTRARRRVHQLQES